MKPSLLGDEGSGPLIRGGEAVSRVPGGEAPQARRVFIECTWTHLAGPKTGVPRVVRNICSRCGPVGRELDAQCVPVVFEGARFWGVRGIKGSADSIGNGVAPMRALLQRSGVFLAGVLHVTFPRRPEITRAFLKGSSKVLLSPLVWPFRKERIAWREGDVLILLDMSSHMDIWGAVARAREAGAWVIVVIHDLIPLTQPQFCRPGKIRTFGSWFGSACRHADAFITVSDSVRADLSRYLESHPSPGGPVARPIDYFHLGCDFDGRHAPVRGGAGAKVRPELKEAFAGPGGTYLTVGTLEVRKNHARLLDAFERVWEKRPDARLCIVGAPAPLSRAFRDRVRRHALHGKRLFLFHDLSDAELSYGYARARALVFPSLAEGFGLPLVEALHYGLPVLASDIPTFREIGEGRCVFFDATSPESMAQAVLDCEAAGPARNEGGAKEQAFRAIDWTESCRRLLSRALRTAPARRHSGTRRPA